MVNLDRQEDMVRATCCNWDVPVRDIVWRETREGEEYALCRDCANEDDRFADFPQAGEDEE